MQKLPRKPVPRRGDMVWASSREGEEPIGQIVQVLYDTREVYIRYENADFEFKKWAALDYEESRTGGVWVLSDEHPSEEVLKGEIYSSADPAEKPVFLKDNPRALFRKPQVSWRKG